MKLLPTFFISLAAVYDDKNFLCASNGCSCESESMLEWENAYETWKSDFKSRNEKHNVCSIRFKKIFTLVWKFELKQWQNDNDYIEGQNITTVAESLQNYIAENEINIDMTNDNFRSLLRF